MVTNTQQQPLNDPIPPMPSDLLERLHQRKLQDPGGGTADPSLIQPGSIWRIELPSGELVNVLVVSRHDSEQGSPFDFARVIPLTDHFSVFDTKDFIITCGTAADRYLAHAWLEGPMLFERFQCRLAQCSSQGMYQLKRAKSRRARLITDDAIVDFRNSLFEQFDPLYSETWRVLYLILDEDEDEDAD